MALNVCNVLEGFGEISRKQAEGKVFSEYDKLNKTQNIESDFDKKTQAFLKAQTIKGGRMNNRKCVTLSYKFTHLWYMNEAIEQSWSARALDRRIGALYYELLTKDKPC